MSKETNYCLRGPDGDIIGFTLSVASLGHEIYDLLDWADEHFPSRSVQQTDGRVYIYAEGAREAIREDRVLAEPFSIRGVGSDNSTGDPPSTGGVGGSDEPGGNVPVGGPSVGSGGRGSVG